MDALKKLEDSVAALIQENKRLREHCVAVDEAAAGLRGDLEDARRTIKALEEGHVFSGQDAGLSSEREKTREEILGRLESVLTQLNGSTL